MTAPTPMIIPSIVRMVRILLRLSAFTAIRSVMRIDMRVSYETPPRCSAGTAIGGDIDIRFGRRQLRELRCGIAAVGDLLIDLDLPVAEAHEPRAVLGDVHLVGDEDDGDAALDVEALEDAHHLDAGPRVEVAGRLVGQDDRGLVDQRARDRHALLLAARQLVGIVMLTRRRARRR